MLSLLLQKQLPGFALDVALDAPQQSIVVLFGPSGAGKSLTLGAIAGFLTPDAGHIRIGERVLLDTRRQIDLPPRARRVGMVRQDLALFPHLTALENIEYGLVGRPRRERERTGGEFLRRMQLEGLGNRRPAELSGGQQQRVALARALAVQPALLLLDEPFSALDLPTRLELRGEVKRLQRELGVSMLFVTHDLGEASWMADHLAVIERGRVLQCAAPDTIFRAPATVRVAQIVGTRNILPATVLTPDSARVGERVIELDVSSFAPGERVYICIRPERVTLVRPDLPPRALPNVVAGDLVQHESDGSNVMLKFRARDARLLPAAEFDLHIDLPEYVSERLNLAHERAWRVSLKPAALHVIRPDDVSNDVSNYV